ncbi:MAG: hypothetical protein HXY41_17085 [Chloroflexi bacterium]|jgi:hypothetical protein|nr:hypothetical protein [Chloroflexota bacterium]
MAAVILKGFITDDGQLKVEVPPDLPPGPVEVEIRAKTADVQGVTVGALLESGLVGLWKDREDITDTVEFARELRKRASRRKSVWQKPQP